MAAGSFASSVAGVVSVSWDYSPCRRRDCVQVWFPCRGVIRHAGGEIVCRCGARGVGLFAMQAERLCAGVVPVCMGFAR